MNSPWPDLLKHILGSVSTHALLLLPPPAPLLYEEAFRHSGSLRPFLQRNVEQWQVSSHKNKNPCRASAAEIYLAWRAALSATKLKSNTSPPPPPPPPPPRLPLLKRSFVGEVTREDLSVCHLLPLKFQREQGGPFSQCRGFPRVPLTSSSWCFLVFFEEKTFLWTESYSYSTCPIVASQTGIPV